MEYIIETDKLMKRFGNKFASNQISIHVKKGSIYGLIGKNGAGKTTLMKLLLGLNKKDSGEIKLLNQQDLNKGRHRMGSLIESPALYKNKTAYENMKLFSYLSKTDDKDIQELLKLVGLENTGKKKAGEFSLGMKQRLGIAIAMLGNPDVLILDEPINGLDPAGIKDIRDLIVNLNKQGVTFMISSHLLDELGKIASDYGIISNGCLVEEISASELQKRCTTSWKIVTDNNEKAVSVLKNEYSDIEIVIDRNIYIRSDIDSSKINKTLVNNDILVYELVHESIGFEDYFIERLGR